MLVNNLNGWPILKEIHTVVFDFDGVFTNNKVYVGEQGQEFVQCDRGDGLAIDFLRLAAKRGLFNAELCILSREKNDVVQARAKKLQIRCYHGVNNKVNFLTQHFTTKTISHMIPWQGLVYLGNDLNDLPLIMRAGFSVVPMDAHPLVKKHATVTLEKCGGDGFVRAFVEQLLNINAYSKEELNEFICNC